MKRTAAIIELVEEFDYELSVSQSRVAVLEESGKDLINYIVVLTKGEPPDKTQKEQVIKAIQVIWGIP